MNKQVVTAKDYTREYFELQFKAFKEMKEWAETRIREVLSFAEPSQKDVIVDIGCGTGTFAIECAKRGSQAYGVDFSREGLVIAKRVAKEAGVSTKVDFINSAAGGVAIKENSINKVICADLVEHLYPQQFEDLLSEAYRILRNGGYAVIYTPSPGLLTELPEPIKELGKRIFKIPKPKQQRLAELGKKYEYLHVDLKSSRSLLASLRGKGFQIQKEIHTGSGLHSLEKVPVIQDFLGGHTLIKAVKTTQ